MKKRMMSVLLVLSLCLSLVPAVHAEKAPGLNLSDTFPDPNLRSIVAAAGDLDQDGILNKEELLGLTELRMDGESLNEDQLVQDLRGVERLPNLQVLEVRNMNLSDASLERCPALKSLTFYNNHLTWISPPEAETLEEIYVQKEDIFSLPLYHCPELKSLTIRDTKVGNPSPRVQDCPKLVYLNLQDNYLQEIDVRMLDNLESLYLSGNRLTKVLLGEQENLNTLTVFDNPLTQMDITGLPVVAMYLGIRDASDMTLMIPDEGVMTLLWNAMLSSPDEEGSAFIPIIPENLTGGILENGMMTFAEGSDEIRFVHTGSYNGYFQDRVFHLIRKPPAEITTANVTFHVEDGTWSDHTSEDLVVPITLYDGSGFVTPDQIPTGMTADPDFDPASGRWIVSLNPEQVFGGFYGIQDPSKEPITKDIMFTYFYEEEVVMRAIPKLLHGGGSAAIKMHRRHIELESLSDVDLPEPELFRDFATYHMEFPDETKTYKFRSRYYHYDPIEDVVTEPWHYCTITVLASDAKSPFPDVRPDHWFHDQVLWAAVSGVTDGFPDGTFKPNDICSRAQIVTFLWRAKGCPSPVTTESPFSDVKPTDWFYDAVLWAVENGITDGFPDGTFKPKTSCTRAQAVTFLYRAEQTPNINTVENPFPDVSENWYYTPVLWAAEEGITDGFPDGSFRPQGLCTRAQIVTFLLRNPY